MREMFTHDFGEAQENSLSGEGATSSRLNYQLFEMNNDITTTTICCQLAGAKHIVTLKKRPEGLFVRRVMGTRGHRNDAGPKKYL